MVATIDINQHVDIRLTTTELMLGDLPEAAAEWEQLPEDERITWNIDWDNGTAGLEELSRYAASGTLTSEDYSRYRQLLVRLGEFAPVINQLNRKSPAILHTR